MAKGKQPDKGEVISMMVNKEEQDKRDKMEKEGGEENKEL